MTSRNHDAYFVLKHLACLAAFSLALLVQGPAAGQAADNPKSSKEQGVPITFDGAVLFYVQKPLGPFSVQERADAVEQRLLLIADDPFYSPELFRVEGRDKEAELYYRDDLVGIVTEADALAAGGSALELATAKIQQVREAIARYRQRRLPEARMRATAIVAVSTVLLIGILFGLRRLRMHLIGRLQSGVLQPGLAQNMQHRLALPAEKVLQFQRQGLWIGHLLSMILLTMVYLEIIFSVMPMTRGYALAVLNYLLAPIRTVGHELLTNIGDFFFIGVMVVLTYFTLKITRWMFVSASEGLISLPGVSPEWAPSLYKIVRLILLAIAAVMIYPYIPGSNTPAFKSIGLFAGALFTFGASGAATNFIGGLMLIFMDAFHLGDRVQIGGVTGDVVDAQLLVTRLRTPKNEIVSVPNSQVLSGSLTNYSAKARQEGLILHTSVTIGYDAPWRKVHDLLIQAALKTPDIVSSPAPFVLQTSLDDFFVTYQINAYTHQANAMLSIYGALHQNIQDTFNAGGVEIMSAHYTSVRDGNTTTIPAEHRGKNYVPPSFRVSNPKD